MQRKVVVGVAAGVVVLLGVAAVVLWPRGTSEVTADDALEDFRDRGSTTTTAADADDDGGPGTVPSPGVYVFSAEGQEEVKLGPLPAETRPLADTVTAVVVDAGDGCFDWTVNLFAEHTEDTRFCWRDGALTIDEHVKHQQIGALSPTATMLCDPNALPTEDEPTTTLECTLDLDGGPAAISATVEGEATVAEAEDVTVGDEEVTATPITVSHRVAGDLSGTWEETTWWSGEGLPVRIERSLDLSGPATFREDSTLELTDLAPRT